MNVNKQSKNKIRNITANKRDSLYVTVNVIFDRL